MNEKRVDIFNALFPQYGDDNDLCRGLFEIFCKGFAARDAEVRRLNEALQWEQNWSSRIGTHGPGCHTWGPSHYECLLREFEKQKPKHEDQ